LKALPASRRRWRHRAFDNDTFATAQYLGTSQNNALECENIVVNGTITNLPPTDVDDTDYYRVALMAGQQCRCSFRRIRILIPL